MLTIDTLVERMGEHPTHIKIDVESFEAEVIEGAARAIGERGTPLFLELHNRMMRERGRDPMELVERLRKAGYSSFRIGGRELAPAELVSDEIVRVLARRAEGVRTP